MIDSYQFERMAGSFFAGLIPAFIAFFIGYWLGGAPWAIVAWIVVELGVSLYFATLETED